MITVWPFKIHIIFFEFKLGIQFPHGRNMKVNGEFLTEKQHHVITITGKGDNLIDASVCIPLHICSITIIYTSIPKKTMIS